MSLVNLTKVQITSVGTGTLSLGAAVPGYFGIENLTDGATYSYSIQQNGNAEVGQGTYVASGPSFTRGPVETTNGNAAIALTGGAQLTFTALASDFGGGGSGSVIDALGNSTTQAASQRAVTVAINGKPDLTSLAAVAGAGLVGLSQSTTYASSTTGAKLQQSLNPLDAPFLATGDGAANDRAALVAADLAAITRGVPVVITSWHAVASNLTITSPVIVQSGGFVAPTGATLSLPGGVEAASSKIFRLTGTGAVAGLPSSDHEWFCGDLNGTTTDATAVLTAWVNSVSATGKCGGGYGSYWVNGATPISHSVLYFEPDHLKISFSGTVTNLFAFTYVSGGYVKNISVWPGVPGTIPTSGSVFSGGRGQTVFENITTNDVWIGWNQTQGVSNLYYGTYCYGSVQCGIVNQNVDQFYSGGVVQALYDWVTITGATGAFNVGDALSATRSVGSILYKYDATHYRIFLTGIEPAAGLALTDTTTGATATISAATIGHQLGGIRWSGACSAICYENFDVLGGLYGFTTTGPGAAGDPSVNPNFCRLANTVFFDTTFRGSLVDKVYGSRLDAWFATSRSIDFSGLAMSNCTRIRIAGHFVNNSSSGLLWTDTCNHIDVADAEFDGNCHNITSATAIAEISVKGATQNFSISRVTVGFTGLFGVAPALGLFIGNPDGSASAAGNYNLVNIRAPSGAIVDSGTGSNRRRVAAGRLSDV